MKVMTRQRNRHGLRNLLLLLGAAALIDANRRWSERFVSASHGMAQVEVANEKPRNGRRIVVQSSLACSADVAWARAKRSSTLVDVTHPLLGFVVRDGRALPEVWRAGDTISLRLLGLGVVPLGPHDITVVRVDDAGREIETRESGRLAPIWNHVVRIEARGDDQSLVTDEVTLAAGPLNPLVGPLAYTLFRYRQTRWQRLG